MCPSGEIAGGRAGSCCDLEALEALKAAWQAGDGVGVVFLLQAVGRVSGCRLPVPGDLFFFCLAIEVWCGFGVMSLGCAQFWGRIGEGQKGYGQMVATFFYPLLLIWFVSCVSLL